MRFDCTRYSVTVSVKVNQRFSKVVLRSIKLERRLVQRVLKAT